MRTESRKQGRRRALAAGAGALGCFALALIGAPTWACSVCACGDPLAVAGQARLTAGQTQLALEVEQLSAQARSDDDPDFIESLTQRTLRAVMAFSPWERSSLIVQVPLVSKVFSQQTPGYPPVTDSPVGLGDVDAGARYFLLDETSLSRRSRQGFALTVGASLPTGQNSAQADGYRLDEHAQLGTGALGPYAGALYVFGRDPWNAIVTVTGRVRLRNAYDYQYGPALQWSLRGEYRLREGLALGLGLDGRYAGRDLHGRTLQANTGGLVLAAAPTLKVRLWDELWLHASAQLPVFTHLFGEQSVGPTFNASVQYTFE